MAADVPTMVVDANEPSTEPLLPDRVEVAADRTLWQEATVGTAEDAVATAYDARHKLALGVGIRHALTVDDRLCLCRQAWPYFIQHRLDVCHLVERDRCAGIPLLAASTMALRYVAAEALGEDVRVYYHVAYHDHRRQVAGYALATSRWVAFHVRRDIRCKK